jgi:predicted DNA-binding transcriptional regulator YafY
MKGTLLHFLLPPKKVRIMRADRLVKIMLLLQNHVKMTTRELADALEVSPRTILRDMDALSTSGIPVVAERGKTGGWRFMDHFHNQLSGMTLSDMKSLFILPSEKILADLGIETEGIDLHQKLLASMPGHTRNEARSYLEKIHIDTDTWKPAKEKLEAFQTVQQALWEDRKLNMVYEKADGTRTQRLVSPLGLVAKGGTWYLVAMSDEGDYRSFRISRIRQANMEPYTFVRPKNFSLAAYWKQSKAEFVRTLPAYEVQVLAHSSIISRMTFTDKFVQQVHTEKTTDQNTTEHEWTPVTLCFPNEQEAVSYILGFGDSIKLLHPEHLIETIVQQAKAVITLYSRSANDSSG